MNVTLNALRPLIINKDGHFVAAVTSMYQSLLEGKTDCPISGVFGAGKTLSAAAMIAGLLVMDPSLTIMIVTKENVAAHAFVKHFLRLGLPESINCLVGRLVGYVEMKKGPANQTALDIPPAFRNDVLRSKRVIVGCGGGFHQECQQPYSPVASWMEEADVALNDEGQQYGNLDEASAIARVPRKCLVVWCGDHKQTPGGLRKTDEAKAFRRKLLRRPIALRGDTKHFQPNMLGKVVLRYRLLYSFSNVCRDFTICFPQNILDQGDIQMRDLKFHALAFMSLQFAAYGRFNCLAFQMCFLLLSRMTFTSH